jgi:hypothetical protein
VVPPASCFDVTPHTGLIQMQCCVCTWVCRRWTLCCRSTSTSWSAASSSHWTADTSAAWQRRQQQLRLAVAAVAHRLVGCLGVPGG